MRCAASTATAAFGAAGALSYTTLVSLVPLAVIAFGILSVFPIFGAVRRQLLALVFRNFVPTIGEQAAWWFRSFADSAAQTTAIGLIGIAATGVLLLVTVEDQLNLIWRVTVAAPLGAAHSRLLDLDDPGPAADRDQPLAFDLFRARRAAGRARAGSRSPWFDEQLAARFGRMLPFSLEFVACTLLYCLIPNCAVRWRDGALGAVDRHDRDRDPEGRVFDLYLAHRRFTRRSTARSPSSRSFCCGCTSRGWRCCSAPWSPPPCRTGGSTSGSAQLGAGGVRLGFSLALIATLARAQRQRRDQSHRRRWRAELGVATTVIDEHLTPARRGRFCRRRPRRAAGCSSWSPETATLPISTRRLHLPLARGWAVQQHAPWQTLVAPAMDRIVAAETAAMQVQPRLADRRDRPARRRSRRSARLPTPQGRSRERGLEAAAERRHDRRDRRERTASPRSRRWLDEAWQGRAQLR